MSGVTISMKEMEYERLKKVLENLKSLAETVDENEDSVIVEGNWKQNPHFIRR